MSLTHSLFTVNGFPIVCQRIFFLHNTTQRIVFYYDNNDWTPEFWVRIFFARMKRTRLFRQTIMNFVWRLKFQKPGQQKYLYWQLVSRYPVVICSEQTQKQFEEIFFRMISGIIELSDVCICLDLIAGYRCPAVICWTQTIYNLQNIPLYDIRNYRISYQMCVYVLTW